MSRPETLFPLFAALTSLPGVGPKGAQLLGQMKIETPRDLLFTLPHSGIDRRRRKTLRGVDLPATVTVEVTVGTHHAPKGRGPARVHVEDAETSFQLVFFHPRGDWLAKTLPTGQRRLVSGRVELFDGVAQMAHPDHIARLDEADDIPDYEPVYPLTAGLTQRTMARAIAGAVGAAPAMAEWIDPELKAREGWMDWHPAIAQAHAPKADGDLALSAPARRRLAYDELFAHQLTLAMVRAASKAKKAADLGVEIIDEDAWLALAGLG